MKAIDIQNLSFAYGRQETLKNVHLNLDEKQCSLIIGPNGGGKSTLLKIILGFLPQYTGQVRIFGLPPELARAQLAYVPQYLTCDPLFPMNCQEIVLSGACTRAPYFFSYPQKEKQRARELMASLEIDTLAQQSYGTLSGGEKQKVLIARALMKQAPLLLLDEPTANIDLQTEQFIYDYLFKLKEKMTLLMVTHQLQELIGRVDSIVCIQKHSQIMKAEEVCRHFSLGLYH